MRTFVAVSSVAFVISAVATWQSTADALFRRMSSDLCAPTDNAYRDSLIWQLPDGLFNHSNSSTGTVQCSFPADSHFNQSQVRRVNVHVTDGHATSEITARTCVTHWWVHGGACSAQGTTNFTGVQVIELTGIGAGQGVEMWSTWPSSFPYVRVGLPPWVTAYSYLRGIFAQDTI